MTTIPKDNQAFRQYEYLMDTTEGQRHVDVIVQMQPGKAEQKARDEFSETIAKTEAQRMLVSDPSELLPPSKQDMMRRNTASRKSKFRPMRASLTAQVERGSRGLDFSSEIKSAKKRAQTFLNIAVVSEAIGSLDKGAPVLFQTADSVQMEVRRNDLKKIALEAGENLGGIYQNKTVRVPQVYETSAPQSGGIGSARYSDISWGLHSTGATSAWGLYDARGQGVKVAVLDTGVDDSHSELAGKMSHFAEFAANGSEVIGAARRDTGTHGTHVAGTIAGGNAGGSWIGMAPQCSIMGGVVLPGGSGSIAQILGGMDWAIMNGAHVINMSLGDIIFDAPLGTPYRNQIINALMRGTVVVAAIGNSGAMTSGQPGNDLEALAVGAHDPDFRCAAFSAGRVHVQAGQVYQKPDVSAPGVSVRSCVPGGNYSHYNGTSMATPHVAGAIAQLLSATSIPTLPDNQRAGLVRDLIEGSVRRWGEPGKDQRYGLGLLDVQRAIDYAKSLGY